MAMVYLARDLKHERRVAIKVLRTTLDLPEDLIEEARRALGFKSKTDTVVLALSELIRRRRVDELKELLGAVELQMDLPAPRRRSRRFR